MGDADTRLVFVYWILDRAVQGYCVVFFGKKTFKIKRTPLCPGVLMGTEEFKIAVLILRRTRMLSKASGIWPSPFILRKRR